MPVTPSSTWCLSPRSSPALSSAIASRLVALGLEVAHQLEARVGRGGGEPRLLGALHRARLRQGGHLPIITAAAAARGPVQNPGGRRATMAEERTTIVDAQAQLEGKLTGKDATVHGRVRGEISLSGRLLVGEDGRSPRAWRREPARSRGTSRRREGARSVVLKETARVKGRIDAAVARGARGRVALGRRRLRRAAPRSSGCQADPAARAAQAPGNARRVKLRELAARLGCPVRGDGERRDPRGRGSRAGRPGRAHLPRQPALCREAEQPPAPRRSCSPPTRDDAAEPRLGEPLPDLRARVALLRPAEQRPAAGVHAPPRWTPAPCSATACTWAPLAVVGAGARIGARSVIHAASCSTREPRSATTACCIGRAACATAAASATAWWSQNGAVIGVGRLRLRARRRTAATRRSRRSAWS